MGRFNEKEFNGEAFGGYVNRIPNEKKSALAKSRAVGTNENAKQALATQTGSLYAVVPYYGRISSSTSQNNDGNTDINSHQTTTFKQGFITASRADSWNERSFSTNITSGVDFMDNVAAQIAEYKVEVKQDMILKMLEGIFGMATTGTSYKNKLAKKFIESHTYNIAIKTDASEQVVNPTTLNNAIQQACGDNKQVFKLVIMHSTVATNLENLKLLKFMTYTDSEGITRELSVATWNGRTVLIDDNMPVTEKDAEYELTSDVVIDPTKTYYTRSGSAGSYVYTEVTAPDVEDIDTYYEKTADGYTEYTTYCLGEGSIILDELGDSVPYEMYRDPKAKGGLDYLYVRDRYMCGADGLSFVNSTGITESATNADLANGANWEVINDGHESVPLKSIAIAKILSRG